MTEPNEQLLRAQYDSLIRDINFAEQAGLSEDLVRRMYERAERLNEKAIAAGFGAL